MELSLRLDTLGMVDVQYLRRKEQYRDWPQFQLTAASRQARISAYMSREVAEQLHQQILLVEEAVGLNVDDDDEDEDEDEAGEHNDSGKDELESDKEAKPTERDTSAFSPAFAQALKQLNELARQRLPDANSNTAMNSGELSSETELADEEEDAIELLQDAFVQVMEVVRELAEEMSTDALKLTGRFKCARTNIEFVPQPLEADDDDEDEDGRVLLDEDGKQVGAVMELQVELVMILQLFEEGRSKNDDVPAVELQLDVDDFERLHETLDIALEHEQRGRRKRQF
jgi:hypothetical protein